MTPDFFFAPGIYPYSISPTSRPDISTLEGCAKLCQNNDTCVGFRFNTFCIWAPSIINGYPVNDTVSGCGFFIKYRPAIYNRSSLTLVQQMIFNNAYYMNPHCPFNLTFNSVGNTCDTGNPTIDVMFAMQCSFYDRSVFPQNVVECNSSSNYPVAIHAIFS